MGEGRCILQLCVWWRWLIVFTHLCYLLLEEGSPHPHPHPPYPSNRRLDGPRSRSGHFEGDRKFLSLQGLKTAIFRSLSSSLGGRDSVVGIATRYGLDGSGIESRCGRDFPHPSRPALGAYPASCTMGTGSFPGVKRPGRGADHPPPPKRRGHERVELYLYSPSVPSWPVIGRTLPLPLPFIQ